MSIFFNTRSWLFHFSGGGFFSFALSGFHTDKSRREERTPSPVCKLKESYSSWSTKTGSRDSSAEDQTDRERIPSGETENSIALEEEPSPEDKVYLN